MVCFCTRMARLGCVAAVAIMMSWSVVPAQTPALEIEVDNSVAPRPLSTGEITVNIINHTDSVGGFTILLHLSRPDLITFVPTYAQFRQFDTVGTLTNNWQIFTSRSVSGTLFDIKIDAIADDPLRPPVVRGFGPSDSPRAVIKIPYVVLPGADTAIDATVNVDFVTMAEYFNVLRPDLSSITWPNPPNFVLDTMAIKVRSGSVKLNCVADLDFNGNGLPLTVEDYVLMLRVILGMSPAPGDLFHADVNGDCKVDTADAKILACYFTYGMSCLPQPFPRATCCNPKLVLCCVGLAGNVDCDPEDRVDISDLSALVDHLYVNFAPLCCYGEANVDGDVQRSVDISDLTALVDYLYVSFTSPAPCI